MGVKKAANELFLLKMLILDTGLIFLGVKLIPGIGRVMAKD